MRVTVTGSLGGTECEPYCKVTAQVIEPLVELELTAQLVVTGLAMVVTAL